MNQAKGTRGVIITGEDPASDCLRVLPEAAVHEDLDLMRAFSNATTLGDLRGHANAWAIVPVADDTPCGFGEWFGEEAFGRIPLARLRTSQLCPAEVMAEFANEDDAVGFVDYEPAPWLAPGDREAIESRLSELGYDDLPRDDLVEAYLAV